MSGKKKKAAPKKKGPPSLSSKELEKLLAKTKKEEEQARQKEIVDMCQQQVLDDEEKSLANDLDGPDISSDTIPKKSKADKAKKGNKKGSRKDNRKDNEGRDQGDSTLEIIIASDDENKSDMEEDRDSVSEEAREVKGKKKPSVSARKLKRKYEQIKMKTVLESSSSSDSDDSDDNIKRRRSKKTKSRGRRSKRSRRPAVTTREDFSPDSRKMISLANSLQRARIATVDAFPTDREKFTLATLRELPGYGEKLDGLSKLDKNDIISYIWRSCVSQTRNELKNKAKIIVPTALFLANNSDEENQKRIEWLQENSRFTKGGLVFEAPREGVEVKDRARVDMQQPYGTSLISDIIALQWYQSAGSDGIKFKTYFSGMPLPLIALVCTIIDNILSVQLKGGDVRFTEEVFKARYMHHLKVLRKLQTNSPDWMAAYQSKLLKEVMQKGLHVNVSSGDISDDDLAGVDFATLNASVSQA